MATRLREETRRRAKLEAPHDSPALPLTATSTDAEAFHIEQPDAPAAPPVDQLIEPGRALAIADFDTPGVNPAERFMRLAYRMGVPAKALRSPFRKREALRLLAAPESPLPGNAAPGMALRAGHFLVGTVKLPLGEFDFADSRMSTPVERVVHGFRWLPDLAAAGNREQVGPVAERILSGWLNAHPEPTKHPAWQIERTASRLMQWLLHAPILLASDDAASRGRLLEAMESNARHLDRKLPRSGDSVAELGGWCAVIAAGLLLPDGKARRLFGEAGLAQLLSRLIGDDGGVLSRSPLMQIEAIGWLVQLRSCYRARKQEPAPSLTSALGLMVPPLLGVLDGDGALGSWQGAGAIAAAEIETLILASEVRTRPLKEPRQWGYQRVTAGKSVLIVDAAPPPLARHAIEGCASTLALAFSTGAQRIFVNCGGAAMGGPQIPPRLAHGLRATAAHSTLCLEDTNSTALLINGKLGNGVNEVEVERRATGQAIHLSVSHDGYAARYGLVHRRILLLRNDGSELRGEDLLVPVGKKGRRGKVGYAFRFHLGQGIDVRLSEDQKGAMLALPDGTFWQFRSACETLSIKESLWVDGNGRPQPAQQLVIKGMVSRGGGSFGWLLKKMR